MSIVLTKYHSKYFPVLASWKTGTVEKTAVFTTVKEAEIYFTGRYGKISIIDRMGI